MSREVHHRHGRWRRTRRIRLSISHANDVNRMPRLEQAFAYRTEIGGTIDEHRRGSRAQIRQTFSFSRRKEADIEARHVGNAMPTETSSSPNRFPNGDACGTNSNPLRYRALSTVPLFRHCATPPRAGSAVIAAI